MIKDIIDTVSLPVMAKVRIGHFVEAQILQAIGVDYIDGESSSRSRSGFWFLAREGGGCGGYEGLEWDATSRLADGHRRHTRRRRKSRSSYILLAGYDLPSRKRTDTSLAHPVYVDRDLQ